MTHTVGVVVGVAYMLINVKKLQFINTVNGDGSKTAKIINEAMLNTLT